MHRKFIFGENINNVQKGNAYFENDITARKVSLSTENAGDHPNPPDPDFLEGAEVRLINNAFAYKFQEAKLSTTGGSDIEHKI